jgi:hypothetical protein
MITLQIIERHNAGLFEGLREAMRSGKLQTFRLQKRGRKVVHVNHPGWMNWSYCDGVIACTILSPRKPGREWQLLRDFLGRIADRYADRVLSISIQFPDAAPKEGKARRRHRR